MPAPQGDHKPVVQYKALPHSKVLFPSKEKPVFVSPVAKKKTDRFTPNVYTFRFPEAHTRILDVTSSKGHKESTSKNTTFAVNVFQVLFYVCVPALSMFTVFVQYLWKPEKLLGSLIYGAGGGGVRG